MEHNGQHVKRFTHENEIAPEPLVGIHKHSTPSEKVELFLSRFAGRDDVFAKRWENLKKGINGYVPACHNEWSPLCPKFSGGKMKCSECPNQDFVKFDANAVGKHLTGQLTIGIYPMFPDETCRFLAFDFDGKKYTLEELRRDVAAIRGSCVEKGISMAVECSRSGKGVHFGYSLMKTFPPAQRVNLAAV